MTDPDWPDLTGKTIAQVIPDLSAGGAERTTVEMAEAITGAGGRAIVISEGGRLEEALQNVGGELVRMKVSSKNPVLIRANAAKMVGLINDEAIDLLHARSRAPAWSARIAALKSDAAFVTTYHGAYSGHSGLKRRYNSVMAKGDLVIANSQWTAAHIQAVHGLEADKIVTIPRGVDFAEFDPAAVSEERVRTLRNAWQLDPDDSRSVLVLPGRLTRWKGQALAIKAVAAMSGEERAKLHLVLPGDSQGRAGYVKELEDLILSHELGGTVSITGHCLDMPAAYMLADIILAPSTRPEAFGRVAAEASAMGKPVVVADHGGQREIVIDGQTGARAEPGNITSLTACIRAILQLPEAARQSMGDEGQRHVRHHFSKLRLQTATLGVYSRVLNLVRPA